tara:strand:- start:69 stop:557 length:489 start_codon:yes stop_codon:yes gene_type:complete
MSIIPVLGIDPTFTSTHDGGFVNATSESFRLGQLGAVIGQPTKLYKWVQNYGFGFTSEAGNVCYYWTVDGYRLNRVTVDVSGGVEIGAGVFQTTVAAGDFGWIQIRGPATLSVALTAGADGDPLTPTGAGDKTLDVAASFTDNICAIAGDISDKEIICMFPY